MNVLFLSLAQINNISDRAIYPDLLREFVRRGHNVYAVSPTERRSGEPTKLYRDGDAWILRVKTGNITKTNAVEKGISTLLLESQFVAAIKRYLSDVHFDLVLYATPPITLTGAIEYIKKRDNAKTYLLLKDIFPQNAVDLGMLSTIGFKALLYHYFRAKEKKLYALSDHIGCMSPANVDYILAHNPEIDPKRVEVCPNSAEPLDMSMDPEQKSRLRQKYGLPLDKTVFVYGGNFGKPQDIPFIIECLKANAEKTDRFFFLCGSGTDYGNLRAYVDGDKPSNVLLLNGLPKNEYDALATACDVGLIFLDYRFTIPNFPSRLLSYLQAELPVLCCTDPNTDIGEICVENGFGWRCMSNDAQAFTKTADAACAADRKTMGETGKRYLLEHYTAEQSYDIIMNSISQ